MSTFRVHKTQNFSTISNEGLRDNRLSFGARGVLAYLLSKPDDWKVKADDLAEQSPQGRHAVLGMLRELKQFGYLHQIREKGDDGRFYWISEIYESPDANPHFSPQSEKCTMEAENSPQCGFPIMENPSAENRTSLEILNKEIYTHTASAQNESQTQTIAHPAKPDAITHSKPNLENVLPSNQTPDLLRGGDLKNAVLDTIGARLRYEMGSFSHADRMRLDAFVNYLHAAQRTPADLSEYEKRLPHYLNKANPNRPTLDQLIKNFDNVLSMDLTPQPTRQPRWQAPAPTPAAPDAAATQTLFAERQARRAALANSQVTP